MKKPPSRFKRVVRELQLILSAAAAVTILYAVITSPLLVAVAEVLPAPPGQIAGLILATVLSHGTLLLIIPAVCFALRWIIDCHPVRLAFGAALLTEAFLVGLRLSVTGLDDGAPGLLELLPELVMALFAGALGTMAARAAGRMVEARMAKPSTPPAPAQPDLAEQLRQAQSTPAAPVAPVEPPKVDPS